MLPNELRRAARTVLGKRRRLGEEQETLDILSPEPYARRAQQRRDDHDDDDDEAESERQRLRTLERERDELRRRKLQLMRDVSLLVTEEEAGEGEEAARRATVSVTTLERKLARRLEMEEDAATRALKRRLVGHSDMVRGEDAEALLASQNRLSENELSALKPIINERTRNKHLATRFAKQIAGYRLGGTSCFSLGGSAFNHLGLRFEETWGGYYGTERYYVSLTPSLELHRHSLPYWIPVEELQASFLPNDVIGFASRVGRYLAAYACREVMALHLEDGFAGKASVTCSPSRDVIVVKGRYLYQTRPDGSRLPVRHLTFKYSRLLDSLPSELVVEYAPARRRGLKGKNDQTGGGEEEEEEGEDEESSLGEDRVVRLNPNLAVIRAGGIDTSKKRSSGNKYGDDDDDDDDDMKRGEEEDKSGGVVEPSHTFLLEAAYNFLGWDLEEEDEGVVVDVAA